MDLEVEGEEWKASGWIRVLEFLYDDDITIELRRERVPEWLSDDGYEVIEVFGSDSPFLEETKLSPNQARLELQYLRDEELIDFSRPFTDNEIIVFRLTDTGFDVAHDLCRTKQEEKWRNENKQINYILTIATGVLTVAAVVQAYIAFENAQLPNLLGLGTWTALAFVLLLILLAGHRGTRGPDFWG